MADIRDAFPSKYLKASDLKGRQVNVTIDRVEYEAVGQSKEMKPILYFQDKDKGLVLNKTNCNKIIELADSPDTDEWPGVRLLLYPTETAFGGEQVECIRIKKPTTAGYARQQVQAPAPPPPPEPEREPVGFIADDDIPF